MDPALLLVLFGTPIALGAIATPVAIIYRGRRSDAEVVGAITDGAREIAQAAGTLPPDALPRAEHLDACARVADALQWSNLQHAALFRMLFGREIHPLEIRVLTGQIDLTDSMMMTDRRPEDRVGVDVKRFLDAITNGGGLLTLLQRQLPMGRGAMATAAASAPIDTRPPAHSLSASSDQSDGRQPSRTPAALLTYGGGNTLPARTPAASLNGPDGTSGSLFTVSGEQRLAQTRQQLWERIYDGLNADNPRLDLDGLWRFYYTYVPEGEELWFHRPDDPDITHCEILDQHFAPRLGLTALPGMKRFPDYMTCKRYEDWDKTRALIQDGV